MSEEKKTFEVCVDAVLCKGCGYCKELCPKSVYDFGTEYNAAGYLFMTPVNAQTCIGCRTCMMVCPDFAIEVLEK